MKDTVRYIAEWALLIIAFTALAVQGYAHAGGYDRSAFKHWIDADSDCQDTRIETLLEHSLGSVTFRTEKNCYIISGLWQCPYTGELVDNPRRLDVDHIVPLQHAWEHGANAWNDAKREKFANDQENLLPVLAGPNRSKGARGPDEWVPARAEFLRDYAVLWIYIKVKYGLSFTDAEYIALGRLLLQNMK